VVYLLPRFAAKPNRIKRVDESGNGSVREEFREEVLVLILMMNFCGILWMSVCKIYVNKRGELVIRGKGEGAAFS
jgi:hypothetical protein